MSACSITASCIDRDDRLGGLRRAPALLLPTSDRAVEFHLERLMSNRTHVPHSWFDGYRAEKGARKERRSSKNKRVGRS